MTEPFIGQITIYGFSWAPRGWAKCDGQLMAISAQTALFSLIGCTYGGDCRTTFALPDLRGRAPIHEGQGGGLTNRVLGSRAGDETVTLNTNQIPAHNHAATAHGSSATANNQSPQGNTWATEAAGVTATYHSGPTDVDMLADTVTTANTGGSGSHNNMQPFLTLNFCIALIGVYPSRS